jgi:hypothetical protein
MKRFMMVVILGLSLAPLAGCVVEPAGPGPHWVHGYYGPYGAWHPGHWS